MTVDMAVVRLTVAQAEALTDAVAGHPGDDWPDDWPPRGDALEAAQEVTTAALDGRADHDECLRCLRYAVDVADHALHGALLRAAQDAAYIILGGTLHAVDGCHAARGAHPAVVEPGGYRGRKIPVFIGAGEADRWLSARGRKRCQVCGVATTRADP
jgi:hypothetical protein